MNKFNFIILSSVFFCFTVNSQSNSPSPYCQPTYSHTPCTEFGPSNDPANWSNDFINSFSTIGGVVDISNNGSGCCGLPNNYIYYCSTYLQVNAAQTITCVIQSGNSYAMGFAVFIDWNQDGIFNNTNEKVIDSLTVPTAASFNNYTFTVPPAQPNGTYRMRVRSIYLVPGNSASFDACSLQAWGEVEDYNVIIGSSPPPPSPITATASPNQTVCAGQNALLGVTYSGTTSPTFSWGGSNSFTSALQNPTVVNTTTASNGYYYVALTTATCPVIAVTHVNILASPSLTVSSTPTAVCVGFFSTITATGANSYTWTGSTYTGSIVQPSISIPSGTYIVTGTNSTNYCASSVAVVVYTMAPPILTVTANSYTHCPGQFAVMSASGGSTYYWGPCAGGSLSSCIGHSVITSASTTLVYTVTGSVPGCSSNATIQITVVPNPTVTAVSNSSLICVGNQATLTASGATNYTWNPNGNGVSIIVTPTVTTTYTVVGSLNNGCQGTDTITQYVSLCTGLQQNGFISDQLSVYPNPFKDELKISCIKELDIKLFDVSGKLIFQKHIQKQEIINTIDLTKGVYFLYAEGLNDKKPIKIIKD